LSALRSCVAIALLVASLAACGGGSASSTGTGDIRIAAREYAFTPPARVGTGVVGLRLVNNGEEPHQAALFRLNSGVTLAQGLDAFRRDPSGVAAAKLMAPSGGANTVLPGRSQRLAQRFLPGAYALFCFVRDAEGQLHAQRGMVAGFTVRRDRVRSAPPRASGTVVLRDAGIELPPGFNVPHGIVRVRNDGTRLHELALMRLPAGRTVADVMNWLDALRRGAAAGPPPFLEAGGVTALPPRSEAWLRTEFDSGSYVAVSFAAAADGRADALGGLLVPFTVA
jgi:hypothetical protein